MWTSWQVRGVWKKFNINTIRIEACAVGTISLKILFIPPPKKKKTYVGMGANFKCEIEYK